MRDQIDDDTVFVCLLTHEEKKWVNQQKAYCALLKT